MAFAEASGTITQSGTDTDLSGLNGLTGVTTTTSGPITTYTLGSAVRLTLSGTCTQNPELERIVYTQATAASDGATDYCVLMNSGAVYNMGVLKPDGNTDAAYSYGMAWQFASEHGDAGGGGNVDDPSSGFAFVMRIGSTLNCNGGFLFGKFHAQLNGTLNINADTTWVIDDSVLNYQSRLFNTPININNGAEFAIQGGDMSIGSTSGGATYQISRASANAGFVNQINDPTDLFDGSADSYATVPESSFRATNIDFGLFSGGLTAGNVQQRGATRILNSPTGTNIHITGFTTGSSTANAGYAFVTKVIDTNIVQLAGGNATGRLFIRDTDNGFRVTPAASINNNITNTAYDDSDDFTYTGIVTDGALSSWTAAGGFAAGTCVQNSAENEVVLAIVNRVRDAARTSTTTPNTGSWLYDLRTNSNTLGEDTFNAHFWSYENDYILFQDNLAGIGTNVYTSAAAADGNIIPTRVEIIATQTADSDLITYTNTGITTSAVTNLDDLYAWIKYNKEIVGDDIELPTAGTMILTPSGSTLLAGSRTLTLGGNLTGSDTNSTFSTTGAIAITGFNLIDANLTGGAVTLAGDVDADSSITGASLTWTTGARNVDGTVSTSAAMPLPPNTSTGTGTFTAPSFTGTTVTLPAWTLNGTGTVAGTDIHTFTGTTFNGEWEFDPTGSIVHVFDGVTFSVDPVRTGSTGAVLFTLGEDDTIASTFPENGVVPTGFTAVLPDITITLNNPNAGESGFGDAYWALYNGTTRISEGNFSGASESITIVESDIGSDTYTLSVVGRGYVEQVDQITYALGDQVFNITEDRSYDGVTTPSTDVTVTSANNTDDTDFRMNLPTGSSAFSTRSSQNATVGANKSNQFYARFVARTGVGIAFESNNDTTWYADGTFTAGIMIVPSDPISTENPALQGARYNNGIDAPILYAQSLETQAAFTAAVVNTLEQTSITATTTTRAEGDSTIDLGAFDATTTSVLIRENIATETDVTDARDTIVGTNGTGNTLSALKGDTEAILDRTQIIIEE